MKFVFVLFYALIFASLLSAQSKTSRNCGTNDYMQQQILKDPSILQRMDAIEKHVQQYLSNPVNALAKNSVINIPVVFHVVYNNSTQNISTAQIQSQIDVLNEDFAALNSDLSNVPAAFQGLIGNSQIQFCLASSDPNGNPTNGILRVSTSVTSFSSNNAIKFAAQGGSNAWPASDYLNFWIGNLSGNLLGYAQFPGGSASTDGVVCLYTSIGRPPANPFGGVFNLGRTATHEVGHWLNLRHIWGDSNCGNDLVNDTPTQQTSNNGCPNFPHVTCSNGPNGDMFMNYMDYVYDACMVMFSAGQAARMNATFSTGGPRASLLNSDGCGIINPCTDPPTPGVVNASSTSVCAGTTITLTLVGNSGGSGETYQWQQSVNNSTWIDIPAATGFPYGTVVNSNMYYRCNVTCGQSTVPTPSVFISATNGSIVSFPHTENFDGVAAPGLPCGWTKQDVNSDGFTVYNGTTNPRSGLNCATYSWNTNAITAANDWLYTPPIFMTAGKNYDVTFWYRARSSLYNESLEIKWGNTPINTSMTGTALFSNSSITNTNYIQGATTPVTPAVSGNYYFGFHVNSAADKFDLNIDDITITETGTCTSPPVGGTISGPSNFEAGPEGDTYTLNNYSGNIQWQFSIIPGGPYTDFTGANAQTIDVISSGPGVYYLRALLTGTGCPDAFSNEFTITVDPRTGDNINKPIVVTNTPYTYTDSITSFAGFTNQNGSQTDGQSSPDVYFRITTGPCIDKLEISTCLSLFDTYIHLLDNSGNVIISNDDNGPFCSGTTAPGSISSLVQPNTTYFIVVEGWSTSTGIFTIEINGVDANPILITTAKQNESCIGSSDGSIAVSVNGGESPYSFIWNTFPAQTVSSLNNLSSGTYTALIADNSGCIKVASELITSPTALIANSIVSHPSGTGAFDGGINLTVLGGTGPYNYLWTTGSTNEDLNNIGAGVYYCFITDANNCAVLSTETLMDQGNRISSSMYHERISDILFLYPNPASDKIFISYLSNVNSPQQLNIYDVNQRKIYSNSHDCLIGINKFEVDISNYSKGVYFIGMESENIRLFKKLMVK